MVSIRPTSLGRFSRSGRICFRAAFSVSAVRECADAFKTAAMLTAGESDGVGAAEMTFSVDDATPAAFCERREITYSSWRRRFVWKEKY
jgi:hypothetical protein